MKTTKSKWNKPKVIIYTRLLTQSGTTGSDEGSAGKNPNMM